eukprot:CAMPEP_0172444798 /NCGR_PEP_ID=MMETSP1065-20121228/4806_1 /TAXON_ID=265537 /ORGANISM="Amphiprora paludosa, Strain CCMP125" /LENGTH=111 /DNA_ID=CAMNT_0013195493 /DNA_START=507 /DNA_END=842 /DNA_ORIENTATION=+
MSWIATERMGNVEDDSTIRQPTLRPYSKRAAITVSLPPPSTRFPRIRSEWSTAKFSILTQKDIAGTWIRMPHDLGPITPTSTPRTRRLVISKKNYGGSASLPTTDAYDYYH